jgi:DNA-binding phage protein
MIGKDEAALMAALEKGDTAVLKKALTDILKTEDGSKIAEQVIKLMS